MPSVCDARRNILPDRTNFLVPPPFGAWGSFSMPAKIAINGYGTIGKRVADAVALQDDMRLVGVAKTKPDFEAKLAVRKAYAVYAANKEALAKFEKAGVKAAGILDDLVNEADLVVDCTPEESGYKALYEKAGVKAIWQGGEEHALTNLSFNAAANYADCIGASFVRVPRATRRGSSARSTRSMRTSAWKRASRSWCAAPRTRAIRSTVPSTRSSPPGGGTASTSSTARACTTSRRSARRRMSCRRTWTRSGRCSSSSGTAAGAWRRRTAPWASESANESAGRVRLVGSLVLPFQALNPLRRPLDRTDQRVELPFARHRATDETAEHDLRARPFVDRIVRHGEQRLERLVEFLFLHPGRFSPRAFDCSCRE